MSELEVIPEQITELQPDGPDDLSAISALIAGDSPEPEQAEEAVGTADLPEPDPVELETDSPEPDEDEPAPTAQVDYEQVVPMPDGGESLTVGQLKDHYQATIDHNQERDTWEQHRMEQDNQLLVARATLNELAGLMGNVDPRALEFVQKQQQANQASEAQKLLQVFPEWADPAVKKAATPALVETMKEYGYTEVEFAHINDHRQIKALSDLSRLRAKEKAGALKREQIKSELPKGQKSVARKQTAAQVRRDKIKRAQNGTEQDKLAAIGHLISGQ